MLSFDAMQNTFCSGFLKCLSCKWSCDQPLNYSQYLTLQLHVLPWQYRVRNYLLLCLLNSLWTESTKEKEDFNHEPNYNLDSKPITLAGCPGRSRRKEANQENLSLEISITTKITLHLKWQVWNYPDYVPSVDGSERAVEICPWV